MDAVAYVNVLKDYVFGSHDWYGMDPGNFTFQQDNASVHTADIVKKYIKRSKIRLITWPPNS